MKKKIAFISTSSKISKDLEKYFNKNDEFLIVDTNLASSLERAQELVDSGIKVIVTKRAVKLKIEKEIKVPVITMENTLSDYVELLFDIENNKKIAIVDFIEPPISLKKLSKLLNKEIVFKIFSDENTCQSLIKECSEEKIDIIVGGLIVKKYAQNYKDIKVYDLAISEDSVNLYKELAKQTLRNIEKRNIKEEVIKNIETLVQNYLDNDVRLNNNVLDKVAMNDVEKDKIIKALKKNSFSVSKAAKDLNISRTTLWRKLKKFNITIV